MTPEQLAAFEVLATGGEGFEIDPDAEAFECPFCDGEGNALGRLYEHKHNASSIAAFGIGESLKAAERFVTQGPAAILALVAEVRRLTRERDHWRSAMLDALERLTNCAGDCERSSPRDVCDAIEDAANAIEKRASDEARARALEEAARECDQKVAILDELRRACDARGAMDDAAVSSMAWHNANACRDCSIAIRALAARGIGGG